MMGRRGGDGWRTVEPPPGWTWELPFAIQTDGDSFRVDPTFDLREYANLAVNKTYYLNTVTGLDSNSGLTPESPKKTWNAIIQMGDYDRIVIQDGSYLVRTESSAQAARDCEIIGEGTVYFTSDRSSFLGAWSLVDGQTHTYQATTGGEFIARVFDEDTPDAFGNPTRYAVKSSIAEVEATPGSMHWAGGTLYVHTLDGVSPSGQTGLHYYDSNSIYWTQDNRSYYFENINFRGGQVALNNASAAGGTKAYFKGCTGQNLALRGVGCIQEECEWFSASGDACNYDDLNGVDAQVIEINCHAYNCGTTTTDQASTSHDGSPVVRIGGKYHDTSGQCVAENVGTPTWMLGCELYNSTTGVGYYTAGEAWLDGCYIHEVTTDLETTTGGTIHKRNLTSGGNFVAAGGR